MKLNQTVAMKTSNSITCAVAALFLSGCIPSVNPYYTDEDVVFDKRLLGEWQEKDTNGEPEIWKFEKFGNDAFRLTTTDRNGKRGEFNAHLFKLRHELFLDLIASSCDFATNQADLVAASMFRGHLLLLVPQIEPDLELAMTDFDWLQKYLDEHPKSLAHHNEDKAVLLTASTRELQRFVLKHLGENELFQKPGVMIRKPNPTTK
jgi:hypothetical protein